jgi:hypothetical protein
MLNLSQQCLGLKSFNRARKTGLYWYNFSRFIPKFLTLLSDNITDQDPSDRVREIIKEELGGGDTSSNHAYLFKESMDEIKISVAKQELDVLNNLEAKTIEAISTSHDPSALCIGISYGLEIIAEENIKRLQYNSSYDYFSFNQLDSTLFFKIHKENEINHIKSCQENFEIIRGQKRTQGFFLGRDISKKFWIKFWREING